MTKPLLLLFIFLFCVSAQSQTKIIIDTDMGTDCDDAGALAMAFQYQSQGLVNVLAVTYETTNSYGPKAISSILTYFNRPNVIIGTNLPAGYWSGSFGYARYVATNFPNNFDSTTHTDAVTVLRSVLAANTGVKLITIGEQRNINQLYFSAPDAISSLNGAQLISNSVSEVVVMGGDYPTGNGEHNFVTDPSQLEWINTNKIVPVTFVGFSIGETYQVNGYVRTNLSNPIGYAFNDVMGVNPTHSSWDLLAMLYGGNGLASYFNYVTNGFVYVDKVTGADSWQTKAILPHKYLTTLMSVNDMELVLDSLLLLPAPTQYPGDSSVHFNGPVTIGNLIVR